MKNIVLATLFICVFQSAHAQSERKGIQMDLGVLLHFNSLNEDNYYDFQNGNVNTDNTVMEGVSLKFTIPTKKEYLDIIFGTLIEFDATEQIGGWNPGRTNSSDHVLNGGGVFAGISPKIK